LLQTGEELRIGPILNKGGMGKQAAIGKGEKVRDPIIKRWDHPKMSSYGDLGIALLEPGLRVKGGQDWGTDIERQKHLIF